jgi:hypothetical protein
MGTAFERPLCKRPMLAAHCQHHDITGVRNQLVYRAGAHGRADRRGHGTCEAFVDVDHEQFGQLADRDQLTGGPRTDRACTRQQRPRPAVTRHAPGDRYVDGRSVPLSSCHPPP